MPQSLLWLWSFILSVVVPVATKIAAMFGMSWLVYEGFNTLYNNILLNIQYLLGSLPSDVINILGQFGVDKALNIIFSAYTVKIIFIGYNRARISFTAQK